VTIDRRDFFSLSASALAAAILEGCNSRGPASADRLLKYAERKNVVVERALFRHTSMDATLVGAHPAGNALPSYFISKHVPVWDESARGKWTLEVGGMVANPIKLKLDDLMKLPRVTNRVNHYCVEGWTAVESWTGVTMQQLAKLVQPKPEAKFVDFQSFDDDYHESWDIDSALHPQTLIVYAQDGHYLNASWGAPARVYSPTKLGYKNTKYLTKVMFMPARNGGYWSDLGYEWYGGV
jgi:DMSO/TMAO reductase YedYZ molybdopterin-dependent catalytic subunit